MKEFPISSSTFQPVLPDLTFSDIAVGATHSLVLTKPSNSPLGSQRRDAYGWGRNEVNQLCLSILGDFGIPQNLIPNLVKSGIATSDVILTSLNNTETDGNPTRTYIRIIATSLMNSFFVISHNVLLFFIFSSYLLTKH